MMYFLPLEGLQGLDFGSQVGQTTLPAFTQHLTETDWFTHEQDFQA